MNQEINESLLKYRVPNVKKYEWAEVYQRPCPKAISANNIISAFYAIGISLFNRRKVLSKMLNFDEKDCESDWK
jgi:hypothetical protein